MSNGFGCEYKNYKISSLEDWKYICDLSFKQITFQKIIEIVIKSYNNNNINCVAMYIFKNIYLCTHM